MKKILSIFMLLLSISTFAVTTTWNGTSWSNLQPTDNDNAIIAGNYTVGVSGDGTHLICRNLTIDPGATFIIKTGYYTNIGNPTGGANGNFENNGTVIVQTGADFWIYGGKLINNSPASNFTIEDGGAMIQFDNDTNEGAITFKRKTKPVKLNDYTYWSSPVANQLYNLLPPFTYGMRIFSYSNSPINYGYGNNLVPTNGTMVNGKGYIAHKGIVSDPNPQQTYTMNFVGVPNNGVISVTLTSFIGNRPNVGVFDGSTYLTGNPYPSSLDMNDFLTVNNSSTIYLWTHNTVISSSIPGSEVYNYTSDDYATYNLSGGVGASAPSPIVDGNINNTTAPTRYIGSGQGFFVKAPELGSKTFNFTNSMRAYLPTTNNTQFYKQNQPDEKNRIWLVLTNNFNITRYNMIGYVSGATDGFDHQYDATMVDGRVAAIYSILDDKNLVIQGRDVSFNPNDKIKLGYKLPIGGNYEIGLNDVDGLFENNSRPIYLEDKLLGITYNLRNGNYSFNVNVAGTVENRFVIKFTKSNNSNKLSDNLIINNNDNNVFISNQDSNIKDIYVYDMLGRLVNEFNNIDNNEKSFTLNTNGIYIIKVKLENDTIITKKITN